MDSLKQTVSPFFAFLFFVFISCKEKSNEEKIAFVSTDEPTSQEMVMLSDKDLKKQKGYYFDFLPTSTTKQIVKHDFFTLSYNEKYEQAEWVAYELKKAVGRNNYFKRPFFEEDPKVKTGSADWRNYKNSGYDKGHLCPAGDMTFDKNAYNDTFLTSNISPQLHDFNDGVWNRLEQKVRYWSSKYDGVYVVTGGVLAPLLKAIGTEKVAVPQYFYKILLDNSRGEHKMIAFLVPNAKSDLPLYTYVVSVDTVEKMTGIDFFPKLDDSIENKLERKTDYKDWSFN